MTRNYPIQREFPLDGRYRVRMVENKYRELYVSVLEGKRLCRGARCLDYKQIVEFLHRFKAKGPIQSEAEKN